MSQELEQEMVKALDGNFYSFHHSMKTGTVVFVRKVPANHCPDHNFENPFAVASKRGAYSRAISLARKSARIWTKDRVAELTCLREQGFGTKKLSRIMNIGRGEIESQLRRMGLGTFSGKPFSFVRQ